MTPINVNSLPLLSKLRPEDPLLEFVFQNLVKYKSIVVFPISAAIITLSNHLTLIFYGGTYQETSLFIQVLMLDYFLIGIGLQTIGQLLNSQKETKINFHLTIIYMIIGLPLGILLIPRYGVIGLMVAHLLATIVRLFYSLWWINKNYQIFIDYRTIFKTFISASVGSICCLILINAISINPWIEVFIGGSILMITYLTSILLTGALTKKNLQDIEGLLIKYEILNPIIDPIFKILFKITRY
jgi:O-antigen/teichoic acid export membrane protein